MAVGNRLPTVGSWTKGTSGNPHGRPRRGETMADYIREAINQEIDGVPVKRLVADMLVMLALGALDPKIRIQAIETIMDYTDGRPAVRLLNAEDSDGNAIPLIIRRQDGS